MTAPQQSAGDPGSAPAPAPHQPPQHQQQPQHTPVPGPPAPGQHAQPAGAPGQPPAYPTPGMGVGPNNENGYPDHTPVQAMSPEQQAAYWRTYARRNEDRIKQMGDYQQLKEQADAYSKLLAETQTEQQKAVTAAEARGRSTALAEAGSQMVEAYVRAAATGRMSEEQVSTLLQGLDRTRFVNPSNGQVDAAMISGYIAMLAPTGPAGWPGAPVYAPPVPATGQVQVPPGTTFTNNVPGQPGQPPQLYPQQQAGYGQQQYPQQQPGQQPWSVYPPQQHQPQQPATPPAMGDGRQVPSYGQAQYGAPPASGFEAGKAVARARFAKPA